MQSQPMAVALLLLAGGLLAAAGAVGLVIGIVFAAWLYSLLPPLQIDVAAVGGAATATGVVLLLLGLAHGLAALALQRREPAALTPVAVLCVTMSLLAIGWATAALVSAASGSGPAVAMLPAGIGLGAVAVGYGWIARRLIGLRQPPAGAG
jgi:hypothetical protein